MQLASTVFAVMIVSAGGVYASSPAPHAPASAGAATQGGNVKKGAPPSAAEIREVGLPGAKKAAPMTIGEMQRLLEEAEINRIRGSAASADSPPKVAAPSTKPEVPSADRTQLAGTGAGTMAASANASVLPRTAAAPVRAEQDPHPPKDPTASIGRWIRTMVIGHAATAEIEVDGRVQAYREGDAIGNWTVGRINERGVWVHRAIPQITSGQSSSQLDPVRGQTLEVKLPSGYGTAGRLMDYRGVARQQTPPLPPAIQFPRADQVRQDSASMQGSPALPVR